MCYDSKKKANMQSPKKRGKHAVRGENEGIYAIILVIEYFSIFIYMLY